MFSEILTVPTIANDVSANLYVLSSGTTTLTLTANTHHDTCLISGATDSTTVIDYCIRDTYTEAASPFSLLGTFTYCDTNLCPTERLDVSGDSVSTLSISQSAGAYSISSTDSTLVGNSYQVYYRALPPSNSLTNCVLYTKAFDLNINTLSIVTQVVPM